MSKEENNQQHCNVLQAIQQELINKNTPFQYVENSEDSINKNDGIFIWVGTRNGYIVHDNCHYEILFNDEKINDLSVEVHFSENKKNSLFDKVVKGHKDLLLLNDWPHDNGFRRIVYKEKISTSNKNVKDIIKNVLRILKELDSQIGEDLVRIVKQSNWNDKVTQNKTELSKKNGSLSAGTRKASEEIRFSQKKYTCAHEAVETMLKEALEIKYNDIDGKKNIVLTERKLGKIKPDF